MELRFQCGGSEKWKTDLIIVPLKEGEKILESCKALDAAAPFLAIAPGMRDVSGREGEISIVYGHPQMPLSRVMFVGLGKELSEKGLRIAFASGIRHAKKLHLSSVGIPVFVLDRFENREKLVEELTIACLLGNSENGYLKTKKKKESLDYLSFCFDEEFVIDELKKAARRGETMAEAILRTRRLCALPGNILYPETFAEKAVERAENLPVSCTILNEEELKAKGFGAHLAVGQGSKRAPRLVVLEYAPQGKKEEAPLVLVGKGITFDSGGISLKPAANMHTMKSDMTGASAVLSAVTALAEEEVDQHIVGIMALAENMPDGGATRPGDVVTSLKGDTVEITNTDAEGRLVLCDALWYAQKEWNPAVIIDVATLTGACVTALGDELAGLFSNNDRLALALEEAGKAVAEDYWRLPLWTQYKKKLKSPIADICHTATREGGAIMAALFLKHFIKEDQAWAHLDIAGVDWQKKDSPLCPEGSTGFSTATLIEFCRRWGSKISNGGKNE